tara:strand:- start:44 stop:250 length:207 start_codon:yes stop_codon:yes gene_type:complete
MKDLINANGTINVHDSFFIQDKELRIIGSEDFYHSGIWNMIEEIKNLDTGKIVKMQRVKLQKYKPFIA